MQTAHAAFLDLRQTVLRTRLSLGGLRGDEIVLLYELLGTVDFQHRVALLDLVAELGNQTGHPAGERRQDDRAGILIVSDLPDRRGLLAEGVARNLHNLQLM